MACRESLVTNAKRTRHLWRDEGCNAVQRKAKRHRLADATVDRRLHHAHIVMTAGDSIRLTQATAGKGVTPLTN